jgi:hypothetical protein
MTEQEFLAAAARFKLDWPLKGLNPTWEIVGRTFKVTFNSSWLCQSDMTFKGEGLTFRDPSESLHSAATPGDTVNLHFTTDLHKFDPVAFVRDYEVFHFLRQCMMWKLFHELDESIKVDGVRVFDPHVQQGRMSEDLSGWLDPLLPVRARPVVREEERKLYERAFDPSKAHALRLPSRSVWSTSGRYLDDKVAPQTDGLTITGPTPYRYLQRAKQFFRLFFSNTSR